MKNFNLFRKPSLSDNPVLIDGFTRTGKMLLGKLVSNLDGVEYFQVYEPLEHIAALDSLGMMQRTDASAFLRMQMDVAIFNRIVGRNLNAKKGDSSCIDLALNAGQYHERESNPDRAAQFADFAAQKRVPLFMTHDCLQYADLFFDVAPDMRVIEMTRHPADLAFSWWQRGWGERWGVDPLALSLALDHKGRAVPTFARDWADDYLDMTPVDRVIRSLATLQNATDKTVDGLSAAQKERIIYFPFERLVSDIMAALMELSAAIGKPPLAGIEKIIQRETKASNELRQSFASRYEKLCEQADPASLKNLQTMSAAYTARHGIDPFI